VIARRGEAQSAQQIQQVVSETIRQLDLSFRLPRLDSIARRLIEDWLGAASSSAASTEAGPPIAKYSENRAFCPQTATETGYHRSLFQRVMGANSLLGGSMEFCSRSTNLSRLSIEYQSNNNGTLKTRKSHAVRTLEASEGRTARIVSA
jgi:hypothetical protein